MLNIVFNTRLSPSKQEWLRWVVVVLSANDSNFRCRFGIAVDSDEFLRFPSYECEKRRGKYGTTGV
jgi:hypothetical protein